MKPRTKNGRFELRLFVAGSSPNSVRALRNLRALCERHLADRFELDVVDVLRDPERALADGVLVTPTLVKLAPGEIQRMIGDLGEEAVVLATFGLGDGT